MLYHYFQEYSNSIIKLFRDGNMTILNTKQEEVANFFEGQALVVAIAGSGKTNTVCHRVARLLEKGINPQNIFMLTFTNKASNEMLHRTQHILQNTEYAEEVSQIISGTFHSIANRFIRQYAEIIGYGNQYTILDGGDSITIYNKFKALTVLSERQKELFKKMDVVHNIGSFAINTNQSIKDVVMNKYPLLKNEIDQIVQWNTQYAEYKKSNNLIDYDDLIVKFIELLKSNNSVAQKIKQQAQFIMVDEYQDTNVLQFELTQLLAETHKNIMVIGDDCQSIYSWRGANYKNMFDFQTIYPDSEVFVLDKNYRSYQGILEIANHTIELMTHKFDKHLETALYPDKTYKPLLLTCYNQQNQAEHIVSCIKKSNLALHKQCALIRNNMHSIMLEKELNKAKIPYVKYGGMKFNELSHVKDFLFILRLILNQNDELAFLRTFTLLPKLGDKSAQKLYDTLTDTDWPTMCKCIKSNVHYNEYVSFLKETPNWAELPCNELTEVVKKWYFDVMKHNYDELELKDRQADVDILYEISQDYVSTASFLSDFALDNSKLSKSSPEDKFIISTIHSAKGLEWDNVYLLNCNNDTFDSYRLKSVEDREEDKRLFYVAVTRAKFRLNLYHVKTNFDGSFNKLVSYLNSCNYLYTTINL